MNEHTSEDTVREFFDACYNRRDVGAVGGLLDPDFVEYSPFNPQGRKGKEAFGKRIESFLRAFPDCQPKNTNIIAKGDTVAVEYVFTGTFKGPLELPAGAIPPNNRHFELPLAYFFRVNAKGLIAEFHSYFDAASMFQQLGVRPPGQ